MTNGLGRRGFLSFVSASGAAFASQPVLARNSEAYTPEVGRKFYPDGRVHPFRGNTVICHVDQQGPNSTFFDALLDLYRQLPAEGFARKIAMLPPSSYHMTIFGGANHPDRKPDVWPAGIPLDTPIEECTRILGERLKTAKLGNFAPIRMRIDTSPASERETPFTIRLLPLDDAENARLRRLRNELSGLFGIRSPNHDSYRFHVTMAYLIRTLNAEELRQFKTAYILHHKQMALHCPVIELGQPEYCSMEDMFAFKRLLYI